MAKADHKDAYKQLPERYDYKMQEVVTLKDPTTVLLRGFIPQAQLFGSTAAVFRYDAVSRATATLAVR